MTIIFANNAQTTLANEFLPTATVMVIESADKDLFPSPGPDEYFMVTLEDSQNKIEICKCIERDDDHLTVERAQEGTTAEHFAAGDKVDLRITRGSLEVFLQNYGDVMKGDLVLDGHRLIDGIIENVTIRNAFLEGSVRGNLDNDVPVGAIIMWSGDITKLPKGWALCDGSVVGVPDLRDRFIVGAGHDYDIGDVGGGKDYSTDRQGQHAHSGTTGGTVLTTDQLPVFSLQVGVTPTYGTTARKAAPDENNIAVARPGGQHFNTNSIGARQPHSHRISTDGDHAHSIKNVLPPYYALAYIMKLPPVTRHQR